MTNRAGQEYWNTAYTRATLPDVPETDEVRLWIEKFVPPASAGRNECFEVGCFPGGYLAVCGNLGYRLSGIDLADRLPLLAGWLAERGYRVGELLHEDFLSAVPGATYDVVLSLGFIEHFDNWKEVLERHCEYVKPGGLLVAEAPNFAGLVQRILHRAFDQQNLGRHCLDAMDVDMWVQVLREKGFEIADAGYFGRFRFWVEKQDRGRLTRVAVKALRRSCAYLGGVVPRGMRATSPFLGVVARRPLETA